MNDLRPILEDAPSEAERRLIDAARIDAPPAEAKAALVAALGLPPAMPASPPASVQGAGAAAAPVVHAAVVVQWIAVIAGACALSLGAARLLAPTFAGIAPGAHATHVVAAPTASRVTSPWVPVPPSLVASALPEAVPGEHSVSISTPSRDPIVAPRSPRASSPSPPEVPIAASPASEEPLATAENGAPSSLLAEVAALADARGALGSGDAAGALRLLDAYGRRFVPPSLGTEATILRIEALAAAGQTADARALATQFLSAHPDSPYARRLSSLVRVTNEAANPAIDPSDLP
jgi:hypothetical protein